MNFTKRNNKPSMIIAALGAVGILVGGSTMLSERAEATPPSGLGAEIIGVGLLQNDFEIEMKSEDGQGRKIKGVRKIATIKFTIDPGGHFGWHTHDGPALAIVTEGEVSILRSDAEGTGCSSRNYGAGETVFDPGDADHIGVNIGTGPVVIYATIMLPIDGIPRLDAPDPGTCGVF